MSSILLTAAISVNVGSLDTLEVELGSPCIVQAYKKTATHPRAPVLIQRLLESWSALLCFKSVIPAYYSFDW